MSWWRRDPTLTPVHRYAQRVLRSREAALRTRCFSRSPHRSAQHEDDDDGRRPAGLSHLEWMQMQHHRRWRKTFKDDPYHALFGASNDMLNGKGLGNWEWVSKSFPSWMVGDMDGEETRGGKERNTSDREGKRSAKTPDSTARPDERPSACSMTDKHTSAQSPYPKKVEIADESDQSPMAHESFFPQPSFRLPRYSRDELGITSPSDLRRPREQPHGTVPSYDPGPIPTRRSDTLNTTATPSQTLESPIPSPLEQSDIFDGPISGPSQLKVQVPNKEVSAREFMEEFFAEKPWYRDVRTNTQEDDTPWAQTALQRRLSTKFGPKTEQQNSASITPSHDPWAAVSTAKVEMKVQGAKSSFKEPRAEESQSTTEDAKTKLPMENEENDKFKDWHKERQSSLAAHKDAENSMDPTTRSTKDILQKLPNEDIDFLTAADIRAVMAGKRAFVDGKLKQKSQKRPFDPAERQSLDAEFDVPHQGRIGDQHLEARIFNEHRRRHQERKVQNKEVPEVSTTSTLAWMKNWVEKSGNAFASHFWQDPSEEADAQKTRLYFDKVVTRVRKGRLAMEEIVDDLKACVPASKPLLRRLKEDEELLDSAIHGLRVRSPNRDLPGLTPKKIRTIQVLRLKFKDTDRELEEAYETLRLQAEGDWINRVPIAFKKKLSIASKITHQNAQLTRSLVWSLQARLEDREIEPKLLPNYTAVANSLLALRDTQMALARLVDRAMLTYNVVPSKLEDVKIANQTYHIAVPTESKNLPQEQFPSASQSIDTAGIRANVAAEERLANEVEAQKLAMQGLSDDGYAQASQNVPKKTFDEQSPLAHSLFRPFGPVLANLGKDAKEEVEVKATRKEPTYATEEALRAEARDVEIMEAWKNDPPVEAISDPSPETAVEPKTDSVEKSAMLAPYTPSIGNEVHPQITGDSKLSEKESPNAKSSSKTTANPASASGVNPQASSTLETSSDSSISTSYFPTHYTILVHDSETDTLSITTSTTAPPRDTAAALPLHQALTTLNAPAKFIPYITKGLEVVSATKQILILRDALDNSSSTRGFETVRAACDTDPTEEPDLAKRHVNPIDGTARLSPTGYVGPEESPEQLEKEFQERRQAANRLRVKEKLARAQGEIDGEFGKKVRGRGRGGVGRVVRTAIWAGAVCYVVGVMAERGTV